MSTFKELKDELREAQALRAGNLHGVQSEFSRVFKDAPHAVKVASSILRGEEEKIPYTDEMIGNYQEFAASVDIDTEGLEGVDLIKKVHQEMYNFHNEQAKDRLNAHAKMVKNIMTSPQLQSQFGEMHGSQRNTMFFKRNDTERSNALQSLDSVDFDSELHLLATCDDKVMRLEEKVAQQAELDQSKEDNIERGRKKEPIEMEM